ncbi:cellulose biosynthesis protein BcsP [Caballeronia sp. RCC_10]|uniref:cellulose biosynthesis protein BcsP n=1 Tax=Caballeronia sp. RCC_10 TaxID=3239227 RepID=UPI0035231774
MNTSRDIEKLFDHFGGNAGEYQEIGRENEARNARTRWPLLATLDFAQPAIPEIAARRESRGPSDAAPTPTPTLTPIRRGKPPLFARSHRRTIPPVNPLAAHDSLSAARFSSLEEAAQTAAPASLNVARPGRLDARNAPAAIPVVDRAAAAASPAIQKGETPRVNPASSILGKLFQPAPAAQAASDDSLPALFHRLRNGGPRS